MAVPSLPLLWLAAGRSAEIRDTEALIGRIKAEIALCRAKAAARGAFESADTPLNKPGTTVPTASTRRWSCR